MKYRPLRPVFVVLLGILFGLALSPSLTGCTSESGPLTRAIGNIVGHGADLPESTAREVARFHVVYQNYLGGGVGEDQFEYFTEAVRYTRANYVHGVDDAKIIDAAIEGVEKLRKENDKASAAEVVEAALDALTASLDPHSGYLNPEESRAMYDNTKGRFGGLGISVSMKDEGVNVISPISGTPAARAGVQAGDIITHIDGRSVVGWTLMQAVTEMRGDPGTDIVITVKRAEQKPFDISITRAIIQIEAVRWRTEGNIGYVRVIKFTEKVESEIEKAMDDIHRKLGSRLQGVVLDLRNNPGGLLSQSVVLSDAFLEDGDIVSIRGRLKHRERNYSASSGDLAEGLPLVVLINEGSASASEIVSAALKQHGRATVMGRRSFGKGSVQTLLPLSNDGVLKLTTQLYFTPKGNAIQANGVEPDIILLKEKSKEEQKDHEEEVRRSEADLPNALKRISKAMARSDIAVKAKTCLPVTVKSDMGKEEPDHELGCALQWLRAGSTTKFVELVNGG